jgi:uncharacterized protein involved in response to NO
MSTSTQRRKYSGIAILSKGYRPFFLAAAIWAVLSLFLWVFMIANIIKLPTSFSPSDWHIHEMIFGYAGAVIAGFLLTAVPNWTGRFPIMGMPLLTLISLWILGRIIILFSIYFHPLLVMGIDILFPVFLALAITREIFAGKNWRNLRVLVVLIGFALANLFFHLEIYALGFTKYSSYFSIAVVLVMIMLIGGRIIPSFTRNWLVRFNLYELPVAFNRFDYFVMTFSTISLAAWVFVDLPFIVAILMFVSGVLNIIRLKRWAGNKTKNEPMLLVLHIAYGFIPLGFIAIATSLLFGQVMSSTDALHLWSAGAIGLITIAMMSRVSLGHSGRKTEADKVIAMIYYMLIASVILRFFVSYLPQFDILLYSSATLWIGSYSLFIVRYWRILTA